MRRALAVTLIEVVVVVAIILVVAGITMVVMLNSKRAAKRITCVGNLSQMGKALALYAADHDNRYPPYNTGDWTNIAQNGQSTHDRNPATQFKRALLPYGMTNDQFYCPEDPQAHKDDPGPPPAYKSEMTYQHVLDIVWFQSIDYSIQDTLIDDPASKVYLGDSAIGYYKPPGAPAQLPLSPHDTVFNALYFDGHVKGVPVQEPKP